MTASNGNGANRAFDACCVIFSELSARSTTRQDSGMYQKVIPKRIERVYIGSLIALFRDLGFVSLGTYHNHKRELVAMGCISQLQKGMFGHTESVWAILRAPSYDLWVRFVGRDFRPRESELWDQHERALENFLKTAPSLYPSLLRQAGKGGVKTKDDFVKFLGGLPEQTLRSLHPLCLGFAVPGSPHTCMIAPLDVLAPGRANGQWKRRRDHLQQLRQDQPETLKLSPSPP